MALPTELLASLQHVKGFQPKAFEAVHASGEQVTAVRFNPSKISEQEQEIFFKDLVREPVPWCASGYYLAQRPSFTFDPLFHAGCYYVQDASSMFLEQALTQTTDLNQPLKVLDLCAAPGGKSTHLQALISRDSLLVSNEVIKNRAGILKQNIYKWGCQNVVVTNNDPQHFKKLVGFFDVVVVDAPCSGSGLFRKDEEAVKEWSESNVQLCCGRQKRILADVLPCLKEGGTLIYSTCSYSKDEDEDIADWLVSENNLESLKLNVPDAWKIVETTGAQSATFGYRFFPDQVKGEGFYMACFRKTTEANSSTFKTPKLEKAGAKEQEIIKPWLRQSDLVYLKEHFFYALPATLTEWYSVIKSALNVQYAGVALGEIMKDKLIPDHALALSTLLNPEIPFLDVALPDAIRYLQRTDIVALPENRGWQLIRYQHHALGWINALQNRVNNYYPKELRILKQKNDTPFEK